MEQGEEVTLKDAQAAIMIILRIEPKKADENSIRLQKHFHVFYLNRLQHLGRLLEESKSMKASADQFNFKPVLNENSAAIADRYRQKIVEFKGANEDLEAVADHPKIDAFNWLAEGASHYKEAWREHAKKALEEERMKECTFKPQI